jgi:hypothetical protein
VTRTEFYYETRYYTEYVNGQPCQRMQQIQHQREVRVTCSSCSGSGRLEHSQVLYTTWQTFRVDAVHPPVPMPHLLAGAEELCVARAPIFEDRRPIADPCRVVPLAPSTTKAVEGAAARVRSTHDRDAAIAVQRVGGRLYRSEFSLWTFHTLRIRFGFLSRQVGWFFGRRPEFHFPRLPFAWGLLGTWCCLPPLFLTSVATLVVAALTLLGQRT